MAAPEGPMQLNIDLLRQGVAALDTIGAECYAIRPPGGGSPIGAHFRHVLDHYQAFLTGLVQGKVDYDARERDHAVESLSATAQLRAEALARELEAIPPARVDAQIMVNACASSAPGCPPEWTPTTVRRELAYLVSHTVHHYALIGVVAGSLDIRLPETFGVAPSTLAYRQLAT